MPDLTDTEPEEPAHVVPTSISLPPAAPFKILIPADYVLIKELYMYAGTCGDDAIRLLRCASAVVSVCCPVLGRMLAKNGIKYDGCGYDVNTYGRAVYRWLHDQGAQDGDLFAALNILLPMVKAKGWPDAGEVVAAMGKSGASGAG